MKKRIIALFCALFMILPLAVACAETQDPNESEASTDAPGVAQTEAPSAETTEPLPQYPVPEAKNLNGFVYRNLIIGNSMWGPIYYSEEGDQNGNIINDALYRREAFLEETFNCQVEHIVDSDALNTLGNHIGSGLDLCEAIYLTGTNTISAALNGYVLDINSIQGLNLDQPWWDQRIQQEYRIGEHLFTLEGDMNMLDELRSICVVFNKTLYNDYNYNTLYGTPYDLVEQNKWTYDTLMEMIKGVTADPTDENGMWGMVAEVSAPYYFFLGLGGKTLVNNGGEFVSNIESEEVMNSLQKTMQLVVNPDVMIVNNGVWFGGNDVWNNAIKVFKSGNALFRSNALSSVNGLMDMASDYGILPVPNNGESNEYYCYVSGGNHRPLSFPSNLKDVENTMLLAEATAYYSRFTAKEGNVSLRDAFYYQLADYRLARSPEDTRMLDIYFDSKTFDIDQTGKVTGLESNIWSLAKAGNTDGVASTIATTKKTAPKMLSKFLENLAKNYD
jgi:hypothetical protein